MLHSQFDGTSSLFAGVSIMPSQATQATDPSSYYPAKNRGAQGAFPLTVKQIAEAYYASDDKSILTVNGSEVPSVRLLGLVMNKAESDADVSFTLDDGTGRIDINRWINEFTDANELAAIQNGMYVRVNARMKGFQGKRHAFSVRPVTDFNDIVLHFIECIYVHVENTRLKALACREIQRGVPAWMQPNPITRTPFSNRVKGCDAPLTNQSSAFSSMNRSGNDVYNLVLGVFQEPAILGREQGLHVDEVIAILGLPTHDVMDAVNYHVDLGHIYSTIDEYHFKSACNG
ncbi:replication protein A 32 kDa subunit B isoform X2 [Elaeis guineensis]|uniref:Replication protein A 32 kDa subunit B isoform X2 n=1 Tax=Elaeis guineensis var. tenera TaxID=51953 RepID=A0A6I9RMM3_ELAGV|nr:replication protein A 32 kDa subunit B isoform X2 [Elaeis guineensis]